MCFTGNYHVCNTILPHAIFAGYAIITILMVFAYAGLEENFC